MDKKHVLSDILLDMRDLLQQIAASMDPAPKACDRCAYRRADGQAQDNRTEGLAALPRGEWLDRQGVMDYLRISYRTYYRFKADGTLRPHRFGHRDYYFLPDLEGAYRESVRKGRV